MEFDNQTSAYIKVECAFLVKIPYAKDELDSMSVKSTSQEHFSKFPRVKKSQSLHYWSTEMQKLKSKKMSPYTFRPNVRERSVANFPRYKAWS